MHFLLQYHAYFRALKGRFPHAYHKMLELLGCFLLFTLSFFLVLYSRRKSSSSTVYKFPRSYPLVGSTFAIWANRHRLNQWFAEILSHTPSGTFVLHLSLGDRHVFTSNPLNVQHILKTKFSLYPKGDVLATTLGDFLGTGIFNADGDNWKFQRQLSSHEFSTKSLGKFVQSVVETEVSDRLVPILAAAAAKDLVLDLQNIFERFAFDTICIIAFGFDPQYLTPSLPREGFAVAFEDAERISSNRFTYPIPIIWKLQRLLNIGPEDQLKQAVSQVREVAGHIVRKKKQELSKRSLETNDLLSRILASGHSGDTFVIDMVISFILAGRDTTSAALTWFFWLITGNSRIEKALLEEIFEEPKASIYGEVKDMIYTHASLCESMRLYPPVPTDTKQAAEDDVLPDGTIVKKGMMVTYHPYAMGRMENLWGKDWAEFKPERWLKWDEAQGRWSFVGRDPYKYPVFQAGPRICLGREMAFSQMKRVVAGVLSRFRVIPVTEEGVQPVYISYLTSKMKNGFPVRITDGEAGRMSQ